MCFPDDGVRVAALSEYVDQVVEHRHARHRGDVANSEEELYTLAAQKLRLK